MRAEACWDKLPGLTAVLSGSPTFCRPSPHPVPRQLCRLGTHQHHRAGCFAHHLLADAAEQRVVNIAMAVRPQNDEFCSYPLGFCEDGCAHGARDEAGNNMNTVPAQLVGQILQLVALQAQLIGDLRAKDIAVQIKGCG